MEKRKNRSESYQYLLVESSYSNEMMEAFSNEDSISSRLNPFVYNEDLIELEDELKKEFWRIADTLLTKRQKEIIHLYRDGYTQMEIGKILSVNQSSVTKNINGNTAYCLDGSKKKTYGGTLKKLKKIMETDEKINEILNKIQELKDAKW